MKISLARMTHRETKNARSGSDIKAKKRSVKDPNNSAETHSSPVGRSDETLAILAENIAIILVPIK